MQDTYEYGQWLLMPHSETKAAFCRKLVAFFVAAQHDGFFGNFHPLPRKDICRTLCILKYHKHLVDGIKRDYVDRLYSPTGKVATLKHRYRCAIGRDNMDQFSTS